MNEENNFNHIHEGAPTEEQPIYHYTRPEQNVEPEPPAYEPPSYETPSYEPPAYQQPS